MTEKSCSEEVLIAQRVKRIRERIALAAMKARRSPGEITLVGVTKTRTAAEVRALIAAGVTDIGENRVQELCEKAPALEELRHKTHLIGRLQRNKVKFLPGRVDMLQSLSSAATLAAIEQRWACGAEPLEVLVEVNIGDEESKSGVRLGEAEELCELCINSRAVRLRGLMAIPPAAGEKEVRRYFAQMRQLFVDIRAKKIDNNAITVLSMGMSSDFEYAILEGSTMVRIGSALFGPRRYA